MSYITDQEGKPYLRYFEDISRIPHESFHEEAIGNYLVKFAEDRKLWCTRDKVGNVLIKKPGSAGYENHEPIALQGHMDMVCEKDPDSNFNFNTDPLQLYVEDGWLHAKGTTLGADDGVAVAYMLAILDDSELEHPPLECIFTVQEEAGVYGATGFDVSLIKAKKMIGLDGTTEGTTTVLTSGVIGGDFKGKIAKESNRDTVFSIKITGLNGGHGASNIGKEQANSIKIAARILYYLCKEIDIRIADIQGGTIRNGIAEECRVLVSIKTTDETKAAEIIEKIRKEVKAEHKESDPGIAIYFSEADFCSSVLDSTSTKKVIDFLYLLPTGTYLRSRVYEGLPVASRNLGTVSISSDQIIVGYMYRCTKTPLLYDLFEQGKLLGQFFNMKFELLYQYSGYEIELGTPLYLLWDEVYKEASGQEIIAEAVHYGTDTGTFFERIEGLDIIIVSPNIENPHRPTERLELASFDRTYQYLKEILKRS